MMLTGWKVVCKEFTDFIETTLSQRNGLYMLCSNSKL